MAKLKRCNCAPCRRWWAAVLKAAAEGRKLMEAL